MANKLAEYGHTFQVKSIACLMTDIGFMGQIYDILDESHYDNDALKWVVKECSYTIMSISNQSHLMCLRLKQMIFTMTF